MNDEPRKLTVDEAISLLDDGDDIHTFRSNGGALLGADWSRKKIISAINEHSDDLEIGGPACRSLGHALVLHDAIGPLFIEANKDRVNELDPQTQTV